MKDKVMGIIFATMYFICIYTMILLKYYDLLIMMIVLLLVVIVLLLILNNIKVRYKLLNRKCIIYADISNSKLIKLYYNERKISNEVYEILSKYFETGIVNRKYTDHFVILTEYYTRGEIVNLINKINEEVKSLIDDEMFILSLKFGIQICYSDDYETNENKAALACSYAKNKPLESYAFYEEEDSINQINEKKMIDTLIKALKNHEFEVYYQPKYDYKYKKIVGSEALVRLIHEGKIIPACEFIEVAEKYGFTSLLDKYVLKEVCKKVKELKKNKVIFNNISINVSRHTLSENGIVEYYLNKFKQYGIKKSEIEIEVTERGPFNDNYPINDTIHELCKNFNVSVDDFGVGNSSLSMLQEKKIKTIKIDREFIVDNTITGRKILSNIIKLTTDLGFELVAEGVENKEQFEFLKSKGCNVIQGYYYSKPLPFDDYVKLLKGE